LIKGGLVLRAPVRSQYIRREGWKISIFNPKFVPAQHPQTEKAQKAAQKWG
jgi:hypothetical protein